MTPNLLKLLWLLLLISGISAAWLTLPEIEPPLLWGLLAIILLMLFCWIWLTVRLYSFRSRFFNFLRRLYSGDYEAGIKAGRFAADELSEIEALANGLAERLRAYDRLRADRVSVQARMLDLILRHTSDRFMTADAEKETFVINPAAQKFLGITRKSFAFEAVLKPSTNKTFAYLFHKASKAQKSNTEGSAGLQLPGMDEPLRMHVLMMPLRDRDEEVRSVLIYLGEKNATDLKQHLRGQ